MTTSNAMLPAVVVCDGRGLVREALRLLLTPRFDVTVVGSLVDLLAVVVVRPPAAVVVELDRDTPAVLTALAVVRDADATTRILAVSDATDTMTARNLHRICGELVPSSAGLRGIVTTLGSRPSLAAPCAGTTRVGVTAPMSAREIEVLEHISAGRTAREISEQMAISSKTVENHKQRIFRKLGVQNQAHAVAVAVRTGVLRPHAAVAAVGLAVAG